jgi:hypothetical protein
VHLSDGVCRGTVGCQTVSVVPALSNLADAPTESGRVPAFNAAGCHRGWLVRSVPVPLPLAACQWGVSELTTRPWQCARAPSQPVAGGQDMGLPVGARAGSPPKRARSTAAARRKSGRTAELPSGTLLPLLSGFVLRRLPPALR